MIEGRPGRARWRTAGAVEQAGTPSREYGGRGTGTQKGTCNNRQRSTQSYEGKIVLIIPSRVPLASNKKVRNTWRKHSQVELHFIARYLGVSQSQYKSNACDNSTVKRSTYVTLSCNNFAYGLQGSCFHCIFSVHARTCRIFTVTTAMKRSISKDRLSVSSGSSRR